VVPRIWSNHGEQFSLEGKVGLITGGNSGIGRAIALGFRAAGAAVVVTGRDELKNARMAEALGDDGFVVRADVRDEHAMEQVVTEASERLGRLDVVVNNAGIGGRAAFLEMSLDTWRAMLDTHLTGTFITSRLAALEMIRLGSGGSIINIGSMYSLFGPPASSHYATSKAGVLGLTRALAVELSQHDIRVNAILPGWIETDMTRTVPSGAVDGIRDKIPLGSFGVPDDLVGAALLLASGAGGYLSGAEIAVDGGYHVADRPVPRS
jgi:2-deoxy-D-gluconate 3-dehydrogenase